MPISIPTALLIGGGLSAGAGVASGLIGANAAGNAAQAQAGAADTAAQLQAQEAQNALNFQQQVYGNQQAEENPFLQTGYSAVANLANLLGILPQGQQGSPQTTPGGAPLSIAPQRGAGGQPINANLGGVPNAGAPTPTMHNPYSTSSPASIGGSVPSIPQTTSGIKIPNLNSLVNPSLGASGSLLAPYPGGAFQAPTAQQAQQMPGYQFELGQGEQAIQNSAAASGDLLNTGTLKNLDMFANNLASTDYQQAYNNALNSYTTNYNAYQNQQANLFNRLASLAGMGQTTAAQLGGQGSQAAGNVSNVLLGAGQQIGQNINNAGAATASGYIGGANALSNALGGTSGNISNLLLLNQLFGGQGAGAAASSGAGLGSV